MIDSCLVRGHSLELRDLALLVDKGDKRGSSPMLESNSCAETCGDGLFKRRVSGQVEAETDYLRRAAAATTL
jgi:hypothetical protein